MANLVLPVPHQAHFFLRAPLRGGQALRAARAPGKLARSWWSGPAACTPTGWRWLRRAGKSCVHGTPRCGNRRLEAERLRRLDWWQAGVLDLDSQRCRRPRGRASSSLVTARCRRCSVTAGSSSSAAVVEAAARSRRSSTPEQTRDGRPSNASARRAPEVLHQRAHSKKADAIERGLRPPNLFQCILHTEARVETPRNNIWPFLATPPPRASGAPRRASAVAVGETDVPPPCCAPPLRTPLLLRAARPGRLLLSPSGRSPPAGGARAYGMTSVALATSPL